MVLLYKNLVIGNLSKTEEIIIPPKQILTLPRIIRGKDVEFFHTYKYLETVLDDRLRFWENTNLIVKKTRQCLLCLLNINSFRVDQLLLTFYSSFIESIFTFFICWFTYLCQEVKNKLQGVVNFSFKILVEHKDHLFSLILNNLLKRQTVKLSVTFHCFEVMPFGVCFRQQTNMLIYVVYPNSFIRPIWEFVVAVPPRMEQAIC